jgi:hypothetical protein
MALYRLSRLPQHSLGGGVVADPQRTQGRIARSPADLGQARPAAQGQISRSLRTREAPGWIVIDRPRGGKAASRHLPPTGYPRASASPRKVCISDKKPLNHR